MEKNILFIERQRFTQWWLWILLLGIFGFILFGFVSQVFFHQSFGNNPMSNAGYYFLLSLYLLFLLFFYSVELRTSIDKDGIQVQFFPFHLKKRFYSWHDIQQCEVRCYKPLLEYGGWGIRGFGDNRALNVKGNQGLQLVFKNGEKLLIGTQRAIELSQFISEHGKSHLL